MKKDNNAFIILQKVYEKQFKKLLHKANQKNITAIMNLSPSFFYRLWLYSPLVDGSVITPASLMGKTAANAYFDHADFYDSVENYQFHYNHIPYTVNNHPVIKDLQLFVETCDPFLYFKKYTDVPVFPNKTVFSIPDNEYIKYIARIALQLKLVKKMPGINATVLQAAKRYRRFFEKDKSEILEMVIDAVFDITASIVKERFMIENNLKEKLREFFYQADSSSISHIDKIIEESDVFFGTIFSIFQMDQGEGALMKIVGKIFKDIEGVIEENLYIPLGYYLKLIEPRYSDDKSFGNNVFRFVEAINLDKKISEQTAVIYEDVRYSRLGIETISLINQVKIQQYFLPDRFREVILKDLRSYLEDDNETIKLDTLSALNRSLDKTIYLIRISCIGHMNMGHDIEIDASMKLEAFKEYVRGILRYNQNDNDDENVEYSYGKNLWAKENLHIDKIDSAPVEFLKMKKGMKMDCYIESDSISTDMEKFRMEVLDVTCGKFGFVYPRNLGYISSILIDKTEL